MADDINNPSVETESLNIGVNVADNATKTLDSIDKHLESTERKARKTIASFDQLNKRIENYKAKQAKALAEGREASARSYGLHIAKTQGLITKYYSPQKREPIHYLTDKTTTKNIQTADEESLGKTNTAQDNKDKKTINPDVLGITISQKTTPKGKQYTTQEFIKNQRILRIYDKGTDEELSKKITFLDKAGLKGEKVSNYLGSIISQRKDTTSGLTSTTTRDYSEGILTQRQYIENAEKEIFLTKETTRNLKEELEIRKAINAERRVDVGGEDLTSEGKQGAKYFKNIERSLKGALANSTKFVKSFGRIALYRTIRTILSAITNSFKDGYEFLKAYNTEAKNVLTNLSYASTALKISVATITEPIAQLLSGQLQEISNSFIDIANNIALQNARAEGQEQVWMINKEAVKQYAEEVQQATARLTALDKFATLSKGTPVLGELVNVKDTQELQKFTKELSLTEEEIVQLITAFENIITTAANFILTIVKVKQRIDEFKNSNKLLYQTLGGLFTGLGAVFGLFSNSPEAAIIAVTSAIIGLSAALYALKIASEFTKDWKKALIVAGVAGAAVTATVLATAGLAEVVSGATKDSSNKKASSIYSSSAPRTILGYATGGYPDSGELYIARENGQSELIGRIGNRSAVANNDSIIESLSNGVFGAVTKAFEISFPFGGKFSSGGDYIGDVYLDREKVGRVVAPNVYTEGVKSGYWKK